MLWRGEFRHRLFRAQSFLILPAILAVLTASCASLSGGSPADAESSLRQRVEAYWRAQQMEDAEALRDLVDPELREARAETIERMGKRNPTSRILSWSIQGVDIRDSTASVHTAVTSLLRHPLLGPSEQQIQSTVRTSWVWKKGRWYVVVEEPSLEKLLEQYGKPPKGP